MTNKIKSFTKSKKWTWPTLQRLLKDRAVLGEWQPLKIIDGKRCPEGIPITDFFPRIISDDLFLQVQGARAQRKNRRGPQIGGWVNLFTGLVTNARDGSNMLAHSVHRGDGRTYRRLLSYAHLQHTAGSCSLGLRYESFEQAVLNFLIYEIDPADVLPEVESDNRIPAKTTELAGVESRLAELQKGLIETGYSPTVGKAIQVMETQQANLKKELAELAQTATYTQSASMTDIRTLADLMEKSNGEEKQNIRLKLRATITSLIENICVLPFKVGGKKVGAGVQLLFRSGKVKLFVIATYDFDTRVMRVKDKHGKRFAYGSIGNAAGMLSSPYILNEEFDLRNYSHPIKGKKLRKEFGHLPTH